MWSSRLFLKLFLSYAGLIVLTVGTCSGIVASWQENQLVGQVRRRLRDSATLLSNDVKAQMRDGATERLQDHVRSLGTDTNTRYTLADALGVVLADSEQEDLEAIKAMDNHLSRQEFIQAQQRGAGFSRRLSSTLKIPFYYYAIQVQGDDETIGYVRAAEPLAAILAEVSSVRRLIGMVGIAVGLTGLLVTFWLTHRIIQPIRDLTQAAGEMADGQPPQRVGIRATDEVGALARAFERMVDRLRRRENALRESADRQSTVLSAMNEGVLAIDENQQVLFANSAAGNILGFIPDRVVHRRLLEVVRSNDLHELAQRSIETKLLAETEIEWQSDTIRTLDVNATPLPGEPCPGVVLVLHDITEIKRLEGLRQQFVANVSHELKTPLSSIKAYTETLMAGALEDPENARKFLGRIDDQSDRLHELIIDLLALARIESGQANIERTAVSLSHIVSACLAGSDARTSAGKITVHNEIADSPTVVFADEESLTQILNNLIDNALKYTPTGGSITLRCKEVDDQAIIEVIDTGPGIDPKHHERLFERFYRVDKARSRELGGTGLGLAIVKHLCNAMNGTVAVDSALGKGSTFCVTIPLAFGQDSDI